MSIAKIHSNTTSPPKTVATFRAQYASVIGIDVHAQILVAVHQHGPFGSTTYSNISKHSGTTRRELNTFSQWCFNQDPELIIMESTGVYWRSVYESLENAGFSSKQIAVVNARDVKNRRGHKTDLADAEHLAEIGRQGSFRKSFIPSREFTQFRTIWRGAVMTKRERQREINILHKLLTMVGCRASSVFSDIRGKIATKIITVLAEGYNGKALYEKVVEIIKHSRGRLKATPEQICEALDADMHSHIWFSIKQRLKIITELGCSYDLQIEHLRNLLSPYAKELELLKTIPGINEISAIGIFCEIGNDLSDFSNIRKFCCWIGLAPGNNESAGKRYSGRTTKGNKYLKTLLTECAQGIGLMKNNSLHDVFQRFKERRGTRRAVTAIAHKLARIIFSVLNSQTAYKDLTDPNTLKNHRLERLQKAADDLESVELNCEDISVKDAVTGETTVVAVKKHKRKSKLAKL